MRVKIETFSQTDNLHIPVVDSGESGCDSEGVKKTSSWLSRGSKRCEKRKGHRRADRPSRCHCPADLRHCSLHYHSPWRSWPQRRLHWALTANDVHSSHPHNGAHGQGRPRGRGDPSWAGCVSACVSVCMCLRLFMCVCVCV